VNAFQFHYDTYQQVRTNLKLALFVLLILDAVILLFIGPDAWRAPFTALITPPLDLSRLESLGKIIGGLLFLPALLAFLMVETFNLHDTYDRYVIRWRQRFDIEFILTRLYLPFAEHVDRRFLAVIEQDRTDCMNRLFYPFVRDGAPLVHPNLVRRFWEAMTRYWLTQLLEILLAVTLGLLLAVLLLTSSPDETARLHRGVIFVLVALALNRIAVRGLRASVRARTDEEITDIVTHHREDLRTRLRQLADSHQLGHQL